MIHGATIRGRGGRCQSSVLEFGVEKGIAWIGDWILKPKVVSHDLMVKGLVNSEGLHSILVR